MCLQSSDTATVVATKFTKGGGGEVEKMDVSNHEPSSQETTDHIVFQTDTCFSLNHDSQLCVRITVTMTTKSPCI